MNLNIEIPGEVALAAKVVGKWFAKRNAKKWKMYDLASRKWLEESEAEIARLTKQRDELVAALEKCSAQLARLGFSANHADEALAKVKGE